MSAFSGPQGRGAMRKYRGAKRLFAEEQQERFRAEVTELAEARNLDYDKAYEVITDARKRSR